jgi:hypothetical protein
MALPKLRFLRFILVANLLVPANAAVMKTTLQPETVNAWNDYVARFEQTIPEARPLLDPQPVILVDLNPNGDVPGGYVHHWIGAMYVPGIEMASAIGHRRL